MGTPRTDIDHDLHCVAVVRVVLQIPITQPWSPTATVDEVHRQAVQEALRRVENLMPRYERVGDPVVEIVTSRKQKA